MKITAFLLTLSLSFLMLLSASERAFAACGGTVRTWTAGAGTITWATANNWSGNNSPGTASEDAVITAASSNPRYAGTLTIGCLEVQSGTMTETANGASLTIAGDYFRNLNTGGITITAGRTFTITMAGTAAQTFENVDPINNLTISNNSTVTFTQPFTIRNTFTISGTTTTVEISSDVTFASAFTIPAGTTVEVNNGASLIAQGNITVNGTLRVKAGGTVVMSSGTTLSVAAGGLLDMAGASGNIANLDSNGAGNTYTLSVAGSVSLAYFKIAHTVAAGLNVTGTIQSMDNGEFHYPASAGYAVTLGAAATIPATMNNVGFYDDSNFANTRNFNASAYNRTATTLNSWSGVAGGAGKENDTNNKINWGAQAGTMLVLTNNTAAGSPPASIGTSSADTLFATFAFALNQASAATDITQVTLTMTGTADAGDLNVIKIYKDTGGGTNCVYNAGVDTQVGSNIVMTGAPPTATITFAAGDVRTSGTTPACFHVLASTSSTAANANTIQFAINATADVTNSAGYSFSTGSGPPISAGTSTITGVVTRQWRGTTSTAWNTAGNWSGATVPTATRDCDIGVGTRVCQVNVAAATCQNVGLLSGGTLDFNNTTNELSAHGTMDGQTGYTFTNAASGVLAMRGAVNQSLALRTAFPGNVLIANTGGAGTNNVNVVDNSTINGNLTVTSGVLHVNDTYTLTVLGNITVQTGASLVIDPGGTLAIGNGKTLTVNSGGTLTLVGSALKTSTVTSDVNASSYNIVVNGTIKAQYYTLDHLGLNGLTINNAASGAVIDPTYHLQNGSFTYPVVNSATMLKLYQAVPTNTMNNMTFDATGSTATSVTNIYTDASIGAGTVTINGYTGTLAGPAYTNNNSYLVSWLGAANTINLTQEAVSPTPVSAGQTYNMGRFGFQQTLAGASYSNANITTLKLTMTGTASASDVSQARIYYDTNCVGSGGVLLGSGTFSGTPATLNFTGLAGATVDADVAAPPKRCVYVEFDIAAAATNGATISAKIAANGDVTNDQTYAISAGTPAPVTLGTPATIAGSTTTTWTGGTSTDWFTATNWTSGVPSAAKTCIIPNATRNPIINGGTGTATCNSVNITTGNLTLQNATTAVLEVYGSFSNSGTFTQNDGTIKLRDTGSPTSQSISGLTSISNLSFNKTLGGTAKISDAAATIATLTFPAGSNFEWQVPSGQTLTLTNGLSLPAATFNVQAGGTVAIPNGKSISVSGGTFKTTGTNDAYPQTLSNKGTVTVSGAGTWSFTATSGTVDLTGFLLDYLDTNGLNIGGTTTITNLNGGQLTHLSTSYSSLKAIQINTTGTIPAIASNVGWMWGAANSTYNNPPSPLSTDAYQLAASTGCASHNITFDQWFGDFFIAVGTPNAQSKVSAVSCTITISASASAVSILAFSATPYNGAVSVDWTTASESNHAGFNVYRSTNPSSGFVQVNKSLIRNIKQSTLLHGTYRYVDSDVANGTTYYYKVEDVDYTGVRTMHGPVSATPDAALAAAPADGATTNSGSSSAGANTGNGPSSPAVPDQNLVDLGNGVHILAQTEHSLRVEIIPPATTYAASAWDATYDTVAVPGYSSMTAAGKPELVERTIFAEVDPAYATASVTNATITEAAVAAHKIAPAPSWTPDGAGVLQPSWGADAVAYASNSYAPSTFYNVASVLTSVGTKKYVQITVDPLLYQASTQHVRSATKIVLDIGLDGAAWAAPTPSAGLSVSPSAVEGALRIRFQQTGMYQLTYDDIANAGLEGFFAGADTSLFRMYLRGSEVPITINSVSGFFSSGDSVQFYANYTRSLEDDDNEIVLSLFQLNGTVGAPLRMQHVNADPTAAVASTDAGTWAQAIAEQNNNPIFDYPLGDNVERFYWGRISIQQGQNPIPAYAKLAMPITLTNLLPTATRPVHLKVYLRGRPGASAINPTHHIGVFVNTVPFMAADQSFSTSDPLTLDFDLPATFFLDGANSITLQALGDLVPAGDFDVMDVDRIEIGYTAARFAVSDFAENYSSVLSDSFTVTGFSTSLVAAYDVTDPTDPMILDNAQIVSPDAGVTYNVTVAPPSGALGVQGYHTIILANTALLKPTSLRLGRGAPVALKASTQGADLLVIGPSELIDAADALITERRAQGLRVAAAPLDQIYAEFSNGLKSSQAIRDFVAYTQSNWTAPAPKYLLILGSATYDPKDYYGFGTSEAVMPVPLEKGLYMDFGNDNWFVATNDALELPTMAVGRIPTSSPGAVSAYVQKLIDYEAGTRSPTPASSRELVFVSDTDTNGEGFATRRDLIALAATTAQPNFITSTIDRTVIGNDAATKTQILGQFDAGPLMMTYIGHGAEDRWSAGNILTNSDADALTNVRLPIVLALDCLNASYYDPDPTLPGLGEKLVLNSSGGAIAFWGSTSMTIPSVQVALAVSLNNQLAQEATLVPHTVRLGDIIMRAKLGVGSSEATRDAIRSYTLFGDPSMAFPSSIFTGIASAAGGSGGDGGTSSSGAKKGLLGCGTIYNGDDNDPFDPTAMIEFALLGMMLLAARSVMRQPQRR